MSHVLHLADAERVGHRALRDYAQEQTHSSSAPFPFVEQDASAGPVHLYRPIAEAELTQKHLSPYTVAGYVVYKCLWPGCSKEFPKGIYAALSHIHKKHLGTQQPFECMWYVVRMSRQYRRC